METLVGYEEYLVQRKDLTLWYYKVAVYGTMSTAIASDHVAPRRGGLTFSKLRFDVVQQLPLNAYEKDVRSKAHVENLATGRADPNYILFDILVFVLAPSTLAVRVIGGAALLFSLFEGESDGASGLLLGSALGYFWEKSLLKLVNIKSGWLVELTGEGVKQAITLASDSSKKLGPATRMLEKIQAFRSQTRREELRLMVHQMNQHLKKIQGKAGR
ncbi:hypothetical protein WME94_57795 [Sorangium sp. So ce429]